MSQKESKINLPTKSAKWALLFCPIAQAVFVYIEQYSRNGSFQCYWDPFHGTASPCNPLSMFFAALIAVPVVNLFYIFTPTLISYPICWFLSYVFFSMKKVRDERLEAELNSKE
jgi:hypothetical protein